MAHELICPHCGGDLKDSAIPMSAARIACAQIFGGDEFHATGEAAMVIQERIISDNNKMVTIRAFAPYLASVAFATISALLIMFAPNGRELAANIVAASLLVLAAGIAGFTRFSANLPGIRVEGGTAGIPLQKRSRNRGKIAN
jgi:hypothetical protein